MISLLLPTRGRPGSLERMIDSVLATVQNEVEIVCYIDDDDNSYDAVNLPVKIVRGPRIIMSDMWNKCAEIATGDIFGLIGDDVVFRTPGWDTVVETAFEEVHDRIVLVYGDDGHRQDFGAHNFIHRRWYETVGYAMPPYFSGDMCDTWLNDVAVALSRRVYIPILTEHMHYAFGKGELDRTHKERFARVLKDKVGELYYSEQMATKRRQDIKKLKGAINGYVAE